MALEIELISKVGCHKDNVSYGSFREWLTPILVRAMVHPDVSRPPMEVGRAFGFIIRRSAIRETFYESMECPHKETLDLAFDLFDRYGRLQKEIKEHVIRKGSGTWKEEVDDGSIVLLEDVKVKRKYQRQRIGTKLVLQFLKTAMASRCNVRFAFARPAANYKKEDHPKANANFKKKAHSNEKTYDAKAGKAARQGPGIHQLRVAGITYFFRSLQFRRIGLTSWLALARDESHPSRRLPSSDDPDPVLDDISDSDSDSDTATIVCNPDFTQTRVPKKDLASHWLGAVARERGILGRDEESISAAEPTSRFPLHQAIKTLTDKDACEFLQSYARDCSIDDSPFAVVDGKGDNIMHIAVKASKTTCLSWMTQHSDGTTLLSMRNNEGYTPLEALQTRMENRRTRAPFGFSRMRFIADEFDGFDDDSITCLLTLQGLKAPTTEQRARAKFGCSCGNCIEGFLSPRMAKKLRDQAEYHYDLLRTLGGGQGRHTWYMDFKDLLVYLPKALQSRFQRDRILQTTFTQLIGSVAACLADNKIPRGANVRQHLRRLETWPQMQMHYFSDGGTVAASVNAIIDEARSRDIEVGEPLYEEEADDWCNGLVECRNDLEFNFVRRHCVDDALPERKEESGFPVPMPWLNDMLRLNFQGKNWSRHI